MKTDATRGPDPNPTVPTALSLPDVVAALSRAKQTIALKDTYAGRARVFTYAVTLLLLPLFLHASEDLVWDSRRTVCLGLASVLFVWLLTVRETNIQLRRWATPVCLLFCTALAFAMLPIPSGLSIWAGHKLLMVVVLAGSLFLSLPWFVGTSLIFGALYAALMLQPQPQVDSMALWLELSLAGGIGLMVHRTQSKLVRSYNELTFTEDARRKFYADAVDRVERAERRFKRLSEASREGLIFHANGQVVDANQSALEILGFDSVDLLTRHILEVLGSGYDRFPNELSDPVNQSMARIKMKRRDGTQIEVQAFKQVLMFAEGSISVLGFRPVEIKASLLPCLSEAQRN